MIGGSGRAVVEMPAHLLLLVSPFLVTGSTIPLASSMSTCPTVDTQHDLNLTEYVAGGKWYVQQSMAVTYLPKADDFCAFAEYAFKDASHIKVVYASLTTNLPHCRPN